MDRTAPPSRRERLRATGRLGAVARWGDHPAKYSPRIRLDELPPDVVQVVRALIQLAADQADLARSRAADVARHEATPGVSTGAASGSTEGTRDARTTTR
jgi:hypothetical protein